jgi:hypothetical protein
MSGAGRGFFADALQHHRHEVTGALSVRRRLAVVGAQRSSLDMFQQY